MRHNAPIAECNPFLASAGSPARQPVLFLRKRACVTVIAGEFLVDRVDMEERMSLRAELLQLITGALGEDGVAGVAIAGRDCAGVRTEGH